MFSISLCYVLTECICPLLLFLLKFLSLIRFDNELTQALEEADSERGLKDKAFQENSALGAEIYALRRNLQVCLYLSVYTIYYILQNQAGNVPWKQHGP